MLKDGTLTYISLFSSAGVGCYGFKQEGFECIATNEFIERRINIQKYNKKCRFETGYIQGDIKAPETKARIHQEIQRYKDLGNDCVDVVIATPPCQGMSVANQKKGDKDIQRNSLVVESVMLVKELQPRFFVFENVPMFLRTACETIDGQTKVIGLMIEEELSDIYEIESKVLNFKDYGCNSSRKRTLVIGVRKDCAEYVSASNLFPDYRKGVTLRQVIGDLPELTWGEICKDDVYHAFRVYPKEMEKWIDGMPEGCSAFDNKELERRPHKVIDGVIVPNECKMTNKYRRQKWDETALCVHTRSDIFASQSTIHPKENRVFSIRELMRMMTIPKEFEWSDVPYDTLNQSNEETKRRWYKKNEIKIRQSIGEAVPTVIFRQVANKIKNSFSN